jgi:hypothetical protein
MESLGSVKDWVTGEAKARYLGYPSVLNDPNTPQEGAAYEVTHEFIINPFYILNYRQFIDAGTIPELLAGDSSIKYSAELEFRKTLTNTGSSKKQTFDSLDGFVGWYGENFNGLNKDYQIKSIAYEDDATADPFDGININTATKVTITVEKIVGSITVYSCGVYLIKVPDSEDDYIGTETDLVDNFLYKSETITSPATTSTNVTTSLVSGDLVIEYTVDYLTAEKLRLTTGDEYMLMIQVEDPGGVAGDSDRLMLIADLRNYVDVDFLAGFVNVSKYEFLQHGQVLGVDPGLITAETSNEDGLLLDAVFGGDTTKNVIINSVTLKLIAYNSADNTSFDLDSYSFAIGDLILSGGLQQIEVDTLRGYPLAVGDDFNLAKITTLPLDGDFKPYSLQLGQKIKWQDWIFNPGVDNVFFDANENNNNLNEEAANYSGLNGYVIKMALVLNVTGDDDLGRTITGDYIHYGGDLSVNDYDESIDGVTGTIETLDIETGQSLAGGILYNGKDTLFRAVFAGATVQNYGIHRIEPLNNPGDGIIEFSSEVTPPVNNLLKPVTGETLLKFDKVGSAITTECIIDGSLITEGVDYRLSARVGEKVDALKDPLQLFGANLHAWFQMDADNLTFNGNQVSYINDLSGNGRHVEQTTGADQPSHSSKVGTTDDDIDGHKCLYGDGHLDDIGNWAGLGTGPYFAVVINYTNVAGIASSPCATFARNDAADTSPAGGGKTAHTAWFQPNGNFVVDSTQNAAHGGDEISMIQTTPANVEEFRCSMATFSTASLDKWINGVIQSPTKNTGTVDQSFDSFRIGDFSTPQNNTLDRIFGIMLISGLPSDYGSSSGNEVNDLHDYLAERYPSLGIVNPAIV